LRIQKCLDAIVEERNGLMEIVKSTLRADLEKMYPGELEVWLL